MEKNKDTNYLYVRRLHTKILYLEACTFSLENAILLYEMNQIDFDELQQITNSQFEKIKKEITDI
jgi:hypothetical protein